MTADGRQSPPAPLNKLVGRSWGPQGWTRLGLLAALIVVILGVAAACGPTPQTTLEPTTQQGRNSLNLLLFVFWAGLAVFVIVEGVLIYVLIRYRRRRGDALPPQTHGHLGLEIGWTIAPTALIVLIAVFTVPVIFDNARTASADALQVRAIGHQWWFEFQYPGLNVTTANELHLPVDQEVELLIESSDVLHSFWVPQLRGKLDMVPGRSGRMVVNPEETGTFLGQCAEFCGTAHALMKFTVVVESPDEFESWVARQLAERTPPEGELAQQGEELITTTGCSLCHTIRGTSAEQTLGPDLTHVGSRKHLAANVLENTPEEMARWLRDPQAIKPGNEMLALGLSEDQIEALVAYLDGLK